MWCVRFITKNPAQRNCSSRYRFGRSICSPDNQISILGFEAVKSTLTMGKKLREQGKDWGTFTWQLLCHGVRIINNVPERHWKASLSFSYTHVSAPGFRNTFHPSLQVKNGLSENMSFKFWHHPKQIFLLPPANGLIFLQVESCQNEANIMEGRTFGRNA